MDRIKLILIYVSVGLSFGLVRGQQIGNYVTNGSFEEYFSCNGQKKLYNAKGWTPIDSANCYGGAWLSVCNGHVPANANTYQFPKTGNSYVLATVYCTWCSPRGFLKNRLKANLQSGKIYCVKFHVNIANTSPFGIDALGAYFGDSSLDTIKNCLTPVGLFTPQVQNPLGSPIGDTLNWVPVSGTFVATGNEKYMVIGNFLHDNQITRDTLYGPYYPSPWSDISFEDATCIEYNVQAYAGPNKLIYVGDSAFIGRQPDWAIDPGCVWYKLPNMTAAIDTISGLWVKPTVTSTYVVRQELDCSPLKWDTVVVTINTNYVGLTSMQKFADNITLAPNPTSGLLKIFYSGATEFRPTSFSIYNSLGQNIRDELLHDISVDIQTSDLGPGLYEIRFRSRYGILTKKFIRTD